MDEDEDFLGAEVFGLNGAHDVGFVVSGGADEGVGVVDPFFFEESEVGAVAVEDGGVGQDGGEVFASLGASFDDGESELTASESSGEA